MADTAGTPKIRRHLCTRCGICVLDCPVGALEMTSTGPVLMWPTLCGGCGLCEDVCPGGAIECDFVIVW